MKINNHTNLDLTELEQQVDRFYPYSKQQLGFDQDPQSINFVSDPENATNMLGKTAFYDPESFSITIYADNRHPKDMMRSLSHELVHHAQNCRGEFDNEMDLGEGYAQEDEHMRNMEKEAYSLGNIVFRDWEDGVKKEINESYRDEDAGVKKLSRKQRRNAGKIPGWESPPEHIKDIGTVHKVIVQFKDFMLPEEREYLEQLREKEHNGTFDENDNWELGFIMRQIRKRKQNMKKEISEGYRGEDAVDNRSLKFKTAHKKKQWSPGQGGGRPGGGIDKKNQAAKVIKQFGSDLTPEELDLLKIYQEREEITGELDKDAKKELMRVVANVLKRKRRMEEMIATPDTVKDAIDGEDSEEDENLTLREANIMSKRNKLEEMVLEYCQTKNFKTLSEVKQVRKVVEKILKENKEKADIDDDGKVSGWEKARSDAIQKNMDKEKTDESKKDDTANLYEAPVTEADLEEEIELEEAFDDLEEIMAMGMDDEQTGNTMAQAKKEAGRTYSKAGKEAALQAQKKSMGITEEEDALEEEEQLQEKTKDAGPKSRGRDEPDRHHKPKNESRRVQAKKSASQINESKFDKKFHDLVKKWCK